MTDEERNLLKSCLSAVSALEVEVLALRTISTTLMAEVAMLAPDSEAKLNSMVRGLHLVGTAITQGRGDDPMAKHFMRILDGVCASASRMVEITKSGAG